MNLDQQLLRLLELGIAELAGISAGELRAEGASLPDEPGGVLAIHPSLIGPDALAPLLERDGKPGFVVVDLTDLDRFTPIDDLDVPDRAVYLLRDVARGDDLRNRSPNEALPAITALGRTPLTICEGLSWLLQQPEVLEPNHCFMTLGSRKRTTRGLDARTPAVWISGGTGRDGQAHRGAPKVGWCWAGNRHSWLGFASAAGRTSAS